MSAVCRSGAVSPVLFDSKTRDRYAILDGYLWWVLVGEKCMARGGETDDVGVGKGVGKRVCERSVCMRGEWRYYVIALSESGHEGSAGD